MTEEDRFFVETIAVSGRNLLMKVNSILKYAESNHKGLGARPSNFRPRLLFEELHKQFAQKAARKCVELDICVQENVPRFIRADREKIQMILIQLLSSAVKFSDSGDVYASQDARKMFKDQWNLYIVVKDQGVGMSAEDLRHIYTPFERINEDTIGKFDGLGLGLTLVYKLVNALRGNIKVHSELGEGSTCVVAVPGAVVRAESVRSVDSIAR